MPIPGDSGGWTQTGVPNLSLARTGCIKHCTSTTTPEKHVYIGVRRTDIQEWECMCFSRDDKILGIPRGISNSDPRRYMDCSKLIATDKASFAADTDVTNFLTVSTQSLPTIEGSRTGGEPNICNSSQVIDVTTVYLAKILGINVGTLIANYVFNTKLSDHTFPAGSSPPIAIYIPDNLSDFPNLEQTYWTILGQYTNATEPNMRKDKDDVWCHYRALAVHEHCKDTITTIGSGCGGGTNSIRQSHCKNLWKHFVEACHRVISRDPSNINLDEDPHAKCMGDTLGNSIYYLHRGWGRSCPEMKDQLHALADNTLAKGWLGIAGPDTGGDVRYRIPGTRMKYKCSAGFVLPNATNPDQLLECNGNMKVDTSHITHCERK